MWGLTLLLFSGGESVCWRLDELVLVVRDFGQSTSAYFLASDSLHNLNLVKMITLLLLNRQVLLLNSTPSITSLTVKHRRPHRFIITVGPFLCLRGHLLLQRYLRHSLHHSLSSGQSLSIATNRLITSLLGHPIITRSFKLYDSLLKYFFVSYQFL